VKSSVTFILDFAPCLGRELWKIVVDGGMWNRSEEEEEEDE
jgi:hypothetical protein